MRSPAHTYQVGDTAFMVVADSRSSPRSGDVSVTKIGRRWITVFDGRQERRFDSETFGIDAGGNGCWAHLWPSKALYEAEVRRQAAWWRLRCLAEYKTAPAHLSAEQIERLIETLRAPSEAQPTRHE